MPTVKFSSFEEAADALLLRAPSASVADRMRELFALSARIGAARCCPSGVKKYRSHDEAEKDRCRSGAC